MCVPCVTLLPNIYGLERENFHSHDMNKQGFSYGRNAAISRQYENHSRAHLLTAMVIWRFQSFFFLSPFLTTLKCVNVSNKNWIMGSSAESNKNEPLRVRIYVRSFFCYISLPFHAVGCNEYQTIHEFEKHSKSLAKTEISFFLMFVQ